MFVPGWLRRRRRRGPCDVPAITHALTYARLYPCGWRCELHRPVPRRLPVSDSIARKAT